MPANSGEEKCYLDRNKALRFEESGKVDHTAEFTIFGQIIQHQKGKFENWKRNDAEAKAFYVVFNNEKGWDWGGLFRDTLTNLVAEVEKSVLPILKKTTNHIKNHGIMRDCFILDETSETPTHERMFKFLGVLLGYCFRSKACLPWKLVPLIWKQIIDVKPNEEDVYAIDAYTFQTFKSLRENAKKFESQEEFEAIVSQNFVYNSSGKEIPLCEGGEEKMVNQSNLEEFIELTCDKIFNQT